MKQLGSYSIGIVGGAGPMASCLLYRNLIEACQTQCQAKADSDFPKILLMSYPFSPMVGHGQAQENEAKIVEELQSCLDLMIAQKMDAIGIACNTLHLFLPKLSRPVPRLISIVSGVEAVLRESSIQKVFVLGTYATTQQKLYHHVAPEVHYPSLKDQERVTQVIEAILEGKIRQFDADLLSEIVMESVRKQGCQAVVLGCTELSVLMDRCNLKLNRIMTIDPMAELARRLINPGLKSQVLEDRGGVWISTLDTRGPHSALKHAVSLPTINP